MSPENPRRSSAIPFGAPEAIPVAPPLPVPRPLQRARDAATRFFGYQSRSTSPQRSLEEGSQTSSKGRSRYASLGATQNATASHRTGLEINTLAINEKGTHAVLGGKEIFRTVKVEDGTFAIGFDLRSAIRSTPTHASGKARQAYAVDIADVAWAKGDCGNYVAAATSSGKIVLYDLGHAGIQAAQLHEHFRQVHKVTFNPHRGSLLLSGSQDGTVRLWDVRDVRQASTLQSKRKYSGQSDGVRDVKWSPTDGVDFAFGTDSGWIQRWDMRNLQTAKVKIPAHSETCNAIDWHPDGKHIASASSDKTVRVWDFSGSRKSHKANWEIKAPYRVSNARWRPSCESSTHGDFGLRQCTQLITTYDHEHPIVHVWDFRRPALPFRELFPFNSAPTDILWHSQDLAWMVGREGTFHQADIQHAPKVTDKRNLQAFTTSSRGDLTFVLQRRYRGRHNSLQQQRAQRKMESSKSGSKSESPQRDSTMLSRSWADDGLDQSFLRSRPAKSVTPQPIAMSRATSFATSTSSIDLFSALTTNLEEVLSSQNTVRPRQTMKHAPLLPHALAPLLFAYMASNYKAFDVTNIPDNDNFLDGFRALFEHNARIAYLCGLCRTSQTWRILCDSMVFHLKKRAEMNLRTAAETKGSIRSTAGKGALVEIMHTLMRENNKSPISSPLSLKPISTIAQQLASSDITSNHPTPLAKPVTNCNRMTLLSADNGLPDPDTEAALALPPSISPPLLKTSSMSHARVDRERKLTSSNLDGLQRLQPNSVEADKRAMVRRWSIQPKEPLNLDLVDDHGIKIQPPKLQRHHSNESFTFLDGSANSREQSYPSSYDERGSGSGPGETPSERPSRAAGGSGQGSSGEFEARDFDDRPEASPVRLITDFEPLSGRPRSPSKLAEAVAADNQSLSKALKNDYEYGFTNLYAREDPVFKLPVRQPPEVTTNPLLDADVDADDDRASHPKSTFGRSILSATEPEDIRPTLYLPQDKDDDVEEGFIFNMVEMLRQLITYYAGKGDAQTAAHLILALAPLLPRTHTLQEQEITQTVASYMDCFTSAGFTHSETELILTMHLESLITSGMQPLQIEAILCTYHGQLTSRKLWNEAAILRRLAYPTYPSVYEDTVKDNHVSVRCGSCKKPVKSGAERGRCESCGVKMVICAFCEGEESLFDEPDGRKSRVVTACLRCGHSLHRICWEEWFEVGEGGGCPTIGCLCDCVGGT